MKSLGRGAALSLVVLLVVVAAAQAAQRVASPTGSASAACSTSDPCDLATAIQKASSGDDVVIESGDYGSSTSPLSKSILTTATNLTVHGPSGGARPRIFFKVTPTTAPDGLSGLDFIGKVTLRGLEVDNLSTSPGAQAIYVGPGSSVDHVIASSAGITTFDSKTGQVAAALIADAPLSIFDTVLYTTNNGACTPSCLGSQEGAEALRLVGAQGGASVVRNDTIVGATGGGNYAVDIKAISGATTVRLENTIIESTFDLAADQQGGTLTVNADHDVISNETSINGASYHRASSVTNVAPVFVDAADHDYHEAASSTSTIGKGAALPATDPTTDLDGHPRTVGPAPDIGAYQLQRSSGVGSGGGSGGGSRPPPVISTTAGSRSTASPSGSTFKVTLPASVTCPEGEHCAVSVTVTLTAPSAGVASALSRTAGRLVIGTARIVLQGGQQTRVSVRLNRRGARLLRKRHQLLATFVVRVFAGTGNHRTRRGSTLIALRRTR